MNDTFWIDSILEIIKENIKQSPEPMTREIVFLYGRDPYLILMSCLLSLQTRDSVTLPVSIELFKHARTPQDMLKVSRKKLEVIIKSINYYKTKAQRLHEVSKDLIERFNNIVPDDRERLLSIKGIGLKTANLVLAEAFSIPAICVDTHVHRLSNHWGLVDTKTPEQTELALKKLLPQQYWIEWNYFLVKWGQSICKSKKCDEPICRKIMQIIKTVAT